MCQFVPFNNISSISPPAPDNQYSTLCFFEFWFFRFCVFYHIVFVFLVCVISLTVLPSMLLQMAGFPSFFLLSNTPLCIYCIYHLFFIHSSLCRHLGCFYVLAIVNNVSINIACKILYWVSPEADFYYKDPSVRSLSMEYKEQWKVT